MNADQAYLEDAFFLLLGIVTVGAYVGLVIQGTPPEHALGLAAGGGLGAAVLARTAVRWVLGSLQEAGESQKGKHLDVAVGEDAPKPSQP